jgi:CheY-like chemotaxis protein
LAGFPSRSPGEGGERAVKDVERAREWRNNPALKNTPIVAVTSYAMAGDREKTMAAGCNGYLEKPINPETFVAEVERTGA